jgi:predicted kinase
MALSARRRRTTVAFLLLLINGAPGVGKSTLARRFADDHALALIIDVDDIRSHLGRWNELDESKVVARELAIALAHDHLVRGHDVIVPQYLARPEFRERLQALADQVGAPFVETVLADDADTVIERFRARRQQYAATGTVHPEAELGDDVVATEVPQAIERLRRDALERGVPMISGSEGLEAAYAALLRCIGQVNGG